MYFRAFRDAEIPIGEDNGAVIYNRSLDGLIVIYSGHSRLDAIQLNWLVCRCELCHITKIRCVLFCMHDPILRLALLCSVSPYARNIFERILIILLNRIRICVLDSQEGFYYHVCSTKWNELLLQACCELLKIVVGLSEHLYNNTSFF